jgi:hypothetical protein
MDMSTERRGREVESFCGVREEIEPLMMAQVHAARVPQPLRILSNRRLHQSEAISDFIVVTVAVNWRESAVGSV